jgi:hypothetical protein
LTYADGRTTPQYEALGSAFAQISQLSPILAPLKLSSPPAAHLISTPAGGAIAALLVHPQTGKRYLFVVAPYTGDGLQTITVSFDIPVASVRNMLNGQVTSTTPAVMGRRAVFTLPAGDGALYECILAP